MQLSSLGSRLMRSWSIVGPILGFGAGCVFIVVLVTMGVFDDLRPSDRTWGTFVGTPTVEFLENGRDLQLMKDFAYLDANGKAWLAKEGAIINGASIPQALWSVVGGPLEGQYRNASILHDEACRLMDDDWKDVHRMFYEACRCGGVPEKRAMMLYGAVFHYGPRWERVIKASSSNNDPPEAIVLDTGKPSKDFLMKLDHYLSSTPRSLRDIENINTDNTQGAF